MTGRRDGEIELEHDPGRAVADAALVFIGLIRSPWLAREDCPKNMNAARETGQTGSIQLLPPFRSGLAGLDGYSHVCILTWFDQASRNLIVQKPRHASEAKGVFALRSPARPNPIGLHVALKTRLDLEQGILHLDAIDALDGTPVIDIKPYFASVDAFPDATRPDKRLA